jgi:carboxymethylenebutenolidase
MPDTYAGVDYARSLPEVDPSRVGVWGYCTGGTLAMLAAAVGRHLAAAVLFFPSQPTFPALTPLRPTHPVDLLWAIDCPVLLIYGGEDPIAAAVLDDVRDRFRLWEVDHWINIYPGAGHAFSAPVPPLHHDAADKASWTDAIDFARQHLSR